MSHKTLPIKPSDIPMLATKMSGCKYKLGAKAPAAYFKPGTGVQIKDIKSIDCSGFVRLLIYKACGVVIPDGSWNQGKWFEDQGFKVSNTDAGKLKDGILRVAILPQQPGPGVGRHIAFILDGKTYESRSGKGVGSRKWNGLGWQGKCKVYVVAYP